MDTPNTEEQIAAHEKNERQAALEATWPVWEVMLVGDEVPWEPRGNPNYWMEEEEGSGVWIAKPAESMPDGATVVDDMVVMAARCSVICRARDEDHAKFIALRAEEENGYHTVEGVRELNA